MMKPLHLIIDGMTCQHCVRAVEGALRGTPGVEVSHVAIGAAELHYDPEQLSVERIVEVVADAGYPATPAS